MFVPLAEGLMVDLAESEAVIDSLLEQLPGRKQLLYAISTIIIVLTSDCGAEPFTDGAGSRSSS